MASSIAVIGRFFPCEKYDLDCEAAQVRPLNTTWVELLGRAGGGLFTSQSLRERAFQIVREFPRVSAFLNKLADRDFMVYV